MIRKSTILTLIALVACQQSAFGMWRSGTHDGHNVTYATSTKAFADHASDIEQGLQSLGFGSPSPAIPTFAYIPHQIDVSGATSLDLNKSMSWEINNQLYSPPFTAHKTDQAFRLVACRAQDLASNAPVFRKNFETNQIELASMSDYSRSQPVKSWDKESPKSFAGWIEEKKSSDESCERARKELGSEASAKLKDRTNEIFANVLDLDEMNGKHKQEKPMSRVLLLGGIFTITGLVLLGVYAYKNKKTAKDSEDEEVQAGSVVA